MAVPVQIQILDLTAQQELPAKKQVSPGQPLQLKVQPGMRFEISVDGVKQSGKTQGLGADQLRLKRVGAHLHVVDEQGQTLSELLDFFETSDVTVAGQDWTFVIRSSIEFAEAQFTDLGVSSGVADVAFAQGAAAPGLMGAASLLGAAGSAGVAGGLGSLTGGLGAAAGVVAVTAGAAVSGARPDSAEVALTKIANYADNNTNAAPTVDDYKNAGVTGVSADNLAAVNARVDAAIKTAVNQVSEVQASVNQINTGLVLSLGGTDALHFAIRNGALVFVGSSLDFESKPSYSVTVTSTDGLLVKSQSLTVNINNVNDAPTASDKSRELLEDGSKTLAATDFDFSNIDHNTQSAVVISSLPAVGPLKLGGVVVTANQRISAADLGAGKLVYAPAANASGTGYASMGFKVQDNPGTANGGVDTSTAANTLAFNVTAVNDAPTAANATDSLAKNDSKAFASTDFGFGDVDGHALSAVITTTLPSAGALTFNGTAVTANQSLAAADIAMGKLVYAPAANAIGYASMGFKVQDNGGSANGGVDTSSSDNTLTFNVTTATLSAGQLGSVTTFELNSKLVLTSNVALKISTGTGYKISIYDDGGPGFRGDTNDNDQTIDVSQAAINAGRFALSADGKTITIHPQWDLDLSSKCRIKVDSSAFVTQADDIPVDGLSVSFGTVTPGTYAQASGTNNMATSSALSSKINDAGAVVMNNRWSFDVQEIGDIKAGMAQLGDLSDKNYVLVEKNYAKTCGGPTNPNDLSKGGQTGIELKETHAGVSSFGADDQLYFDSQVNNSSIQKFDSSYADIYTNTSSAGQLSNQKILSFATLYDKHTHGSDKD